MSDEGVGGVVLRVRGDGEVDYNFYLKVIGLIVCYFCIFQPENCFWHKTALLFSGYR